MGENHKKRSFGSNMVLFSNLQNAKEIKGNGSGILNGDAVMMSCCPVTRAPLSCVNLSAGLGIDSC